MLLVFLRNLRFDACETAEIQRQAPRTQKIDNCMVTSGSAKHKRAWLVKKLVEHALFIDTFFVLWELKLINSMKFSLRRGFMLQEQTLQHALSFAVKNLRLKSQASLKIDKSSNF